METQAAAVAPSAAPAIPKPGSAMEEMRQALRAKVKNAPTRPAETQPPPAKPQAESKTSEQESPEAPPGTSEQPDATTGEPQVSGKDQQTGDQKGGKVSPWRLVEQYKSRVGSLEKEIADLKTSGISQEKRNEYLKQIEEHKKEAEALREEIRFLDYSKHPEFKQKYQVPYENAWKRAMSELSEISLTDPETGNRRAATADDLYALVNMPLGKARETAESIFGTFADDVMQHRKAIRELYDAQSQALMEAKTKGAEREKQQRELNEKQTTEVKDFISKTWESANAEITTDQKYGRYVSPEEGDQEGNQRLAKGFELVDRAWSEDPRDPNLTPEQRASIVRRHAAVRNRAAAFGKLLHLLQKTEAEKAALAKELEGFKQSVPPAGGSAPAAAETTPSTARDEIFGALRKLAK